LIVLRQQRQKRFVPRFAIDRPISFGRRRELDALAAGSRRVRLSFFLIGLTVGKLL
jgi:hypothetical protein